MFDHLAVSFYLMFHCWRFCIRIIPNIFYKRFSELVITALEIRARSWVIYMLQNIQDWLLFPNISVISWINSFVYYTVTGFVPVLLYPAYFWVWIFLRNSFLVHIDQMVTSLLNLDSMYLSNRTLFWNIMHNNIAL